MLAASDVAHVSQTQETICKLALRLLAHNFYKRIEDSNYVCFLLVLEDEKKASTF